MRDTSSVMPSVGTVQQEPFGRIVPLLKAALLLGVGGGFLLTLVLATTTVLSIPLTTWWLALAQAYDHLQLYGWAGLFVIGIVFHFLPRLRGVPLEAPWLIPWIVGIQATALLLRLLSQPLLVLTENAFWRILLVLSGVFECGALGTAVLLFVIMIWRTTRQTTGLTQTDQQRTVGRTASLRALLYAGRPKRSIELGLGGAFASLALAALVNLGNVVQAAADGGLVLRQGDNLDVTLVLFGFLIPVALMLSVHSLPTNTDRESLPQQIFWPLSTIYFIGLALTFIATSWIPSFPWLSVISGCGMILLALVLLAFISVFLHLMDARRRLLRSGSQLSPHPQVTDFYQTKIANEPALYRPFVLLIVCSYAWALLGSLLLIIDGVALIRGMSPFVSSGAMRYSFASGFIALLFAGLAVRMLPRFSGHKIAGSVWVTALFWLGNTAVFLRVGPLLLLPILVIWNHGITIYIIMFDLSAPVGLAFAICLALTLWPALRTIK